MVRRPRQHAALCAGTSTMIAAGKLIEHEASQRLRTSPEILAAA